MSQTFNDGSTVTSTIATLRIAARIAGALAAIGVATALPAAADPLAVAGRWNMVQENGYTVNLNLTQNGVNVNGTANTSGMTSNNVTGTVTNHSIDLTIPWTTGSVGIYRGELTQNKFALPGGYFTGTTFDQTHPWSRAKWYSDGTNLPW